MNLTFIPTRESDREFFVRIHHEAYRPVIEKMFGWDEAVQDAYANKAFDLGGMKLICLDDQKVGVVGYEDHADYLWLKEVFLLPKFQGKGVGSEIIKDAIAQAKSKAKELRLQTLRENLGARRLYERHGLRVTEATDTHWKMAFKP